MEAGRFSHDFPWHFNCSGPVHAERLRTTAERPLWRAAEKPHAILIRSDAAHADAASGIRARSAERRADKDSYRGERAARTRRGVGTRARGQRCESGVASQSSRASAAQTRVSVPHSSCRTWSDAGCGRAGVAQTLLSVLSQVALSDPANPRAAISGTPQ